jgi:hypothetical protein
MTLSLALFYVSAVSGLSMSGLTRPWYWDHDMRDADALLQRTSQRERDLLICKSKRLVLGDVSPSGRRLTSGGNVSTSEWSCMRFARAVRGEPPCRPPAYAQHKLPRAWHEELGFDIQIAAFAGHLHAFDSRSSLRARHYVQGRPDMTM